MGDRYDVAGQRFLSTLPARGATTPYLSTTAWPQISIHAPREGSDYVVYPFSLYSLYFYPRSPRGERLIARCYTAVRARYFYPRSPRGERPLSLSHGAYQRDDFYPRSPRGERPAQGAQESATAAAFLSTLPARGATIGSLSIAARSNHFYPRSPRGERP